MEMGQQSTPSPGAVRPSAKRALVGGRDRSQPARQCGTETVNGAHEERTASAGHQGRTDPSIALVRGRGHRWVLSAARHGPERASPWGRDRTATLAIAGMLALPWWASNSGGSNAAPRKGDKESAAYAEDTGLWARVPEALGDDGIAIVYQRQRKTAERRRDVEVTRLAHFLRRAVLEALPGRNRPHRNRRDRRRVGAQHPACLLIARTLHRTARGAAVAVAYASQRRDGARWRATSGGALV